MPERAAVLLSDVVAEASLTSEDGPSTSRRSFLKRISMLAALPAAPLALDACGPQPAQQQDTLHARRAPAGPVPLHNPDSRLDTVHGTQHPTTTAVGAGPNAMFQRYDPTLPPLPNDRTQHLHWTARELPIRISASTVVGAWTFEGNMPGPIVRCRVGDTIDFTLTNEGAIPHSMDFHAAQIDPKTAFRSVAKGQSVGYTFKPRYPGAFLYHCGSSPVLMHLGAGMFGAIIVDPPQPLPRAKEFVLVQNEFYLSSAVNGVQPFDYTKMLATLPDYVAFNGRPGQYQAEPIRVKRGDLVRFYVVDAGPTIPCAFHIVGEQFDTVYLGAPPANAIHGVQTFNVAAGGGMIFELRADVAGEFPFVNHGFGHGQKGAIGILSVEP